jgi:hypothetical protein
MPIQPWRTFLLSGVVPASDDERRRSGWPLEEPHRADPRTERHTQAARLFGRTPLAQIVGGEIRIDASMDREAVHRSGALTLDEALLNSLQGGDVLTIARTMTGDVGVSLVRGGALLWAVGAVAAVPLGGGVRARLGPPVADGQISASRWPSSDSWLDVSCGPDERTLRDGEAVSVGGFAITVHHAARPSNPGPARRENAAITRADGALHEAARRAAERLDRGHGGLVLQAW